MTELGAPWTGYALPVEGLCWYAVGDVVDPRVPDERPLSGGELGYALLRENQEVVIVQPGLRRTGRGT